MVKQVAADNPLLTVDLDLSAIAVFLDRSEVEVRGRLRSSPISGGRSNLTYSLYDDVHHWVLRRPPVAGLTVSAHDMAREWAVTTALQGSAVPVAQTIAADLEGSVLGAPFTLVDFVSGLVIRSDADLRALDDDAVTANARAMVEILVRLHGCDYNAIGLAEFGRPHGFLQRQVKLWARQWEQVKTREVPDVERLSKALTERVPVTSRAALIHGDLRVDNTILDPEDPSLVLAVVDWELSALGDPLTDIALMCAYRNPLVDLVLGLDAAWTSDRYPKSDQLAHWYSEATGSSLDDWGFYTALAHFKLAVIAEGITHRAVGSASADDSAMAAARAAPELIATGLEAMRGPG